MARTLEQVYFVFCPRDGESTEMKGNSIISIQNCKNNENVTIPQEVKDPETGKKILQENSIPGVNYKTSISHANIFTKEAIVKVTRKTKSGEEVFTFKINDKGCATFMDDNYIMKFGISNFELEEYADPSEADEITRRNVEIIRKLANLNKVNVLSTEDHSSGKPSHKPEDEPTA